MLDLLEVGSLEMQVLLGLSLETGASLGFLLGGNLETNVIYQSVSLPEFKFSKMESELKNLVYQCM